MIKASGSTAQLSTATSEPAMVSRSTMPNGAGNGPGPRLASQLRVKLGTIRPPISTISMTITAMPSRQPAAPVSAQPRTSACISALATRNRPSAATIGRLRQFSPVRISRRTTPRRTSHSERSIAAASPAPISAETATAILPASQRRTRPPSGAPCSGSRPVQLGMAVSRKPQTAAPTKPNSISWACQASGSKAVARTGMPAAAGSHSSMDSTPQSAAAKKNGRKP